MLNIAALHSPSRYRKLAFWLIVSFIYSSNAQQPVATQQIIITSDITTISGLSGNGNSVFTYNGNVKISRGFVEITGNEAVVTMASSTNKVIDVLVTGSAVYFQQSSELDENVITGNSDTIEYKVDEALVEFRGAVSFNQPGILYKCEQLNYRVEQELARGIGHCEIAISN